MKAAITAMEPCSCLFSHPGDITMPFASPPVGTPRFREAQPPPPAGAVLDLLHDWVPDAAVHRQILVETPARLYDFPD